MIHLRWMQIVCYFPVSKQSLNSSPSGSRLLLATCLANRMWQKQLSGFSKAVSQKALQIPPRYLGIPALGVLSYHVRSLTTWKPPCWRKPKVTLWKGLMASEVLGLLPRNLLGVIPVQAPATGCQRWITPHLPPQCPVQTADFWDTPSTKKKKMLLF